MKYPIKSIRTTDGLALFGFLAEAEKSHTILINIHGTASSFYVEEFEPYFIQTLPPLGLSLLFTNNRGNYVMESWQPTGAAQEKFEDCLIDIDAWIEYALSLGYQDIILQGHSLGSEKVVYYLHHGQRTSRVKAVILLGFSDSYGMQQKYLQTIKVDPMIEARELVKQNKGHHILTSNWLSHAGVLPQNAHSYINFFTPGSELSKALPLRQGKNLTYYRNIQVPILGVISDGQEHTVIPTDQAIDLLRQENPQAKIHQIQNTDHSFNGKQTELVDLVQQFLTHHQIISPSQDH